MDRIKRFCKERDSALLSLDVKKIREFAKKWKVPMPTNETVFLGGCTQGNLQSDYINGRTEVQQYHLAIGTRFHAGDWINGGSGNE